MQGIAKILHDLRPLSQLAHPRETIRQFTPNWFAATMGTGILALALPQLPGRLEVLRDLGELLWFADIALFCLFALLYSARWIFFWHEAKEIFGHSVVSMFFGTIPMGLATIINGLLVFGYARWGDAVLGPAQGLWWLDLAMSLACGVAIPYLMFTRQEHTLDQMTAVWLLPVVAAEVAAVTGGMLAPLLAEPQAQLVTLVVGYVLWAFSVPIACSILAILLLRMSLHRLPHENMAASSWLALGPLGTGSLGLLILGKDALPIFAAKGLAYVGSGASAMGLILGVMLWGFGLWWLLLATLITIRYFRRGIPFNLGWWGYTFPLGVYTVATLRLGANLEMPLFSVLGTVLAGVLALMWVVVASRTLYGAWRGDLLVAPCLSRLACGGANPAAPRTPSGPATETNPS